MSVTLATIADALIEFILSLLRDPDAAAEFDADPQSAMAARGLNSATAADVCAVAPIIVERAAVVERAVPATAHGPQPGTTRSADSDPVVREVQNIVHNFAWVDDRDTIVDQSVNQNIWANGDVTQTFDQEATVASGQDAVAAGQDVDIEQTQDNSTTITAGNDVNVGNESTETVVEDSYNETTDASTTTDALTEIAAEDSANDSSETQTLDGSYNSSTTAYTETSVDVDSSTAFESTDTTIADDTATDDDF